MLGGVLLAGLHLDRQHQAQLGHHVGVVGMRRPPRLVRVVAELRALLMAVERLDGRVHVQDPRLAQQRPHAVVQMPLQPRQSRRLVHRLQRPPHRVLAHHLAHPQQPGVHAVAAQAADVRVPPMPGQHRQEQRAQNVAHLRRVRARVEAAGSRPPTDRTDRPGADTRQKTAADPAASPAPVGPIPREPARRTYPRPQAHPPGPDQPQRVHPMGDPAGPSFACSWPRESRDFLPQRRRG